MEIFKTLFNVLFTCKFFQVAYVDTLLKLLGFGKGTGIQNKDH